MGKVGLGNVDKYQTNSRGFFRLENDKDVASVRFMYRTLEEVDEDVLSVHRIKVGDQDRYVNCLREGPNDPESDCPFCAAGWGRTVRLFLQVAEVTDFDKKTKEDIAWEAKVFDRGPNFAKKISSIFERAKGDICGTMYEIERQGKKGDTSTDYGIFAIETDGLKIDDLPARKSILGSVVLDKTFEEMDAFVQTDQFPGEGEAEDDEPVRRRGKEERGSRKSERDVPSRGRGRRQEEEDDEDEIEEDIEEEEEEKPRRRSSQEEEESPRRGARGGSKEDSGTQSRRRRV